MLTMETRSKTANKRNNLRIVLVICTRTPKFLPPLAERFRTSHGHCDTGHHAALLALTLVLLCWRCDVSCEVALHPANPGPALLTLDRGWNEQNA